MTLSDSILIDVESFICSTLETEPEKYQFYYCLGVINWYLKGDQKQAANDFKKFLAERNDVEYTLSRENLHLEFDMVVLATGIVPNATDFKMPFELKYDDYGFIDSSTSIDGVFAAGCARHPCDVSRTTKDSTAAALKAIQCLKGGE